MSHAPPVPARLAATLAAVALGTSGCLSVPGATDLVADGPGAGPGVSRAEAAGALRTYVEVVNEALATGETEELAAMTGPECPCRALVGLVDERFAGGAELVGASFAVAEVSVLERRGPGARVRARISVSPYDVRNRDGLMVGSRPAQEYVATYTVQRRDEEWSVVDVRQARVPGAGERRMNPGAAASPRAGHGR